MRTAVEAPLPEGKVVKWRPFFTSLPMIGIIVGLSDKGYWASVLDLDLMCVQQYLIPWSREVKEVGWG